MPWHVSLRIDGDVQAFAMRYYLMYVVLSIVTVTRTLLHASVCEAHASRPVDGEAFCINDVPVEDVVVVLMQDIQQSDDGGDGEVLAARVQHEAAVCIEIMRHGGRVKGTGCSMYSSDNRRGCGVIKAEPETTKHGL